MSTNEKFLKNEIDEMRKTMPDLGDDEAFVLWFLQAEITEPHNVGTADMALVGGTGDKSLDAVYIDHESNLIHIIQGKFHRDIGKKPEKRDPIMSFVHIAEWIRGDRDSNDFEKKLNDDARPKFQKAKKTIKEKEYGLRLYFITTHKCSDQLKTEAKNLVHTYNPNDAMLYIYDAEKIMIKYQDYLQGVAPGIPEVKLAISAEKHVHTDGVLRRNDKIRGIESRIFTVSTKDIGRLYETWGVRLFARNIRGYLGPGGQSSVNHSIKKTLEESPENFWYYNNGITMVCYDFKDEDDKYVAIKQPQIINGQQTTITLSHHSSDNASVLVKLIKIPAQNDNYKQLIDEIVKATNWQNFIKAADLVSNDPKQIWLERMLKNKGYAYLRKRRSREEINGLFGKGKILVKKEDVAKTMATCYINPDFIKREDDLYNEDNYQLIFRVNNPIAYLNTWWLLKFVKKSAPKTEATRANWQVLYLSWATIKNILEKDVNNNFEKLAKERNSNIMKKTLESALKNIFYSALRYYNSEKGKGSDEIDIKSFFGRKNLHLKFSDYWKSKKNIKYKQNFEKSIKKFEKIILPE